MSDLRSAEETLGHPLPDVFVNFMTKNRAHLEANAAALADQFAFTASDLDAAKLVADLACDCVHAEPPEWLSDHFILGSDGGGGFFMMRRDGAPQVLLMDSDWYSPPEPYADSLESFVHKLLD